MWNWLATVTLSPMKRSSPTSDIGVAHALTPVVRQCLTWCSRATSPLGHLRCRPAAPWSRQSPFQAQYKRQATPPLIRTATGIRPSERDQTATGSLTGVYELSHKSAELIIGK